MENARRLAACPDVDALYIKDPGGLLLPQRARVLIPAIKAVIGDKALELHGHCTIGLAELAYMDAPYFGVSALQCASGAAADGTSNPPSERVVDRFARIYTPLVVAAALLVATVPALFGADASTWVYRALALLIVACPCSLVISIPVAVISAIGAAARGGARRPRPRRAR